MEVFGGFMVMMSIISLFLAVVWLIMPFVVFAIKGKQERTLELLEGMEKRLSTIEGKLAQLQAADTSHRTPAPPTEHDLSTAEHTVQPPALPLA